MNRDEAVAFLEENVGNSNLRKHCLACEAIMRRLAGRFAGDAEAWGLCGLLHDIDYDQVGQDPERHAVVGAEMLEARGVAPEIVEAVKGHNDKAPRDSHMARALYAADPASGFIVACALIRKDKKLAPVDVAFMKKRFREKRFAANASREQMAACSGLGMELDEFLGECLEAMKTISSPLGL
jgi:putative nucleotidyltransferase with HDIG domain